MNRFILTKNGVVFCLLSIAMGAVTLFGGTKAEALKKQITSPVQLLNSSVVL